MTEAVAKRPARPRREIDARAARPLPRVDPARPARPARARAVRAHRRARATRSRGRSRRRARSSARSRGSRSCCSRTPRGCCPSTGRRCGSVAIVGPLANVVLARLVRRHAAVRGHAAGRHRARSRTRAAGSPGTVGVNWVGDMSDAAVEIARKRKVAIVVVGSHPEGNAGWEVVTSPVRGQGGRRPQVARRCRPGQEDFVRRVHRREPANGRGARHELPGRAALGRGEREHDPARDACEPGARARASATCIFGDADPGGRLAQTWPRSLADLPPMMDYDLRRGRTYMYATAEPQYAVRARAQLHDVRVRER